VAPTKLSRILGALRGDVIQGAATLPWGVWMPRILDVKVGERLDLPDGSEYVITHVTSVLDPSQDKVQCRIRPSSEHLPAEEKRATARQWINLKISNDEITLCDQDGKSIPATSVDIKLRPGELPEVTLKVEQLSLDVETQAVFAFSDEALAELAAQAGYKLEPIDVNLETELGEEDEEAVASKWPYNIKWEPGEKALQFIDFLEGQWTNSFIVDDLTGEPVDPVELQRVAEDAGYYQELPSDTRRDRGGDGIHGRYREEQPRKVLTDQVDGSGPLRENRRPFRKGGS